MKHRREWSAARLRNRSGAETEPGREREVSRPRFALFRFRRHRRFLALISLVYLLLVPVLFLTPLQGRPIPRFRLKEERARDFFEKGLHFYNTRHYIAAREFFYKALNVDPFFHLARRYLGDSYYYSGDWNSALEQWESLDDMSDGAYPLVKQRSSLLRFYLSRYRDPGEYTFFGSYQYDSWRDHTFASPVDLGLDDGDNLFVLSYKSANLLQISQSGDVLHEWSGSFWKGFKGPLAFARSNDLFYVCEYSGDRIRAINNNGFEQLSFGGTGSAPGQLRGPSGIVVQGNFIYVSDSGNRRIEKFDRNGKFLLSFGADDLGNRPIFPAGLAMDEKGTLFAADRDGGRIFQYDADGNYLGDLRSPLMKSPRGLSIRKGRLLVADEKNGILFYDPDHENWSRLTELRNDRDAILLFNRPFAVREDENGILYVAEYGSHRVDVLMPRGLRTSNLDVKVESVVSTSYPTMALFVRIRNRLGHPIPGLTHRNILIYENDRRQSMIRTDNIRPYNQRVNVVVLKENTNFFRTNYDSDLPGSLTWLLEPIRITDRFHVVRIGEQVRPVYEGLKRREMLRILGEGDVTDEPNLGKGLYESISLLLPAIGPRHVVFVTSGRDFPGAFDQYDMQRIIQYAKANGISIHVISFEGEPDPDRKDEVIRSLNNLATSTGGRYYRAFDDSDLKGIYERLRQKLDDRYILTYKTQREANQKGRYVDLRVEVHSQGTTGNGDAGYFVPGD